MTASYPIQLKTFTKHNDFTDTIFAAMANDLQDEVLALETALGVLPQNDQSLTSGVKAWLDVKARLKSIQENDQADAWNAYKTTTQNIPSGSITTVAFSTPANPGNDTGGLWTSGGITIKRAGWYGLSMSSGWNYSSATGFRETGVLVNGSWLMHVTDGEIIDSPSHPGLHQNAAIEAVYLSAGARLVPVVHHDVTGTLSIATARFTGIYKRAAA